MLHTGLLRGAKGVKKKNVFIPLTWSHTLSAPAFSWQTLSCLNAEIQLYHLLCRRSAPWWSLSHGSAWEDGFCPQDATRTFVHAARVTCDLNATHPAQPGSDTCMQINYKHDEDVQQPGVFWSSGLFVCFSSVLLSDDPQWLFRVSKIQHFVTHVVVVVNCCCISYI